MLGAESCRTTNPVWLPRCSPLVTWRSAGCNAGGHGHFRAGHGRLHAVRGRPCWDFTTSRQVAVCLLSHRPVSWIWCLLRVHGSVWQARQSKNALVHAKTGPGCNVSCEALRCQHGGAGASRHIWFVIERVVVLTSLAFQKPGATPHGSISKNNGFGSTSARLPGATAASASRSARGYRQGLRRPSTLQDKCLS